MLRRRHFMLALVAAAIAGPGFSNAFDHQHSAWTVLLRKHVLLLQGGVASQVRYAGAEADRALEHTARPP